jgi:hypothetical protein
MINTQVKIKSKLILQNKYYKLRELLFYFNIDWNYYYHVYFKN